MTITWAQIQLLLRDLDISAKRHERLSTASQAAVYRIWQESGERLIFKVTDRPFVTAREAQVDRLLRRQNEVLFARVVAHGQTGPLGYIAYEDLALVKLLWNAEIDRQVAKLTAAIHRLPELWPREEGDAHTPGAAEVFDALATLAWSDIKAGFMQVLGEAKATVLDSLEPLLHAVQSERGRVEGQPLVFCHGDLHRGNVMVSERTGALYIIDWEFAHVDSPLYDLFQWLDATSPRTPLTRTLPRTEAVQAYYAACEMQQALMGETEFVVAYHLFAAAYLLWIALRVSSDHVAGRFSSAALRRQQGENLRALVEIAQTLRETGFLYREVAQ